MEKQGKREVQRHIRRQQILECALELIIRGGFSAMKIREIAERLNISTGLFFNYFESKEQVYEELIKIGLSGPASVLGLKADGIEPIVLFERMTESIFHALKADAFTGKMFLLMAYAIRSQETPEGVKKLLEGFDSVTSLVEIVLKGQMLHQIKKGDAVALIMAYWGAVQGIAEYYAMSTGIPLPESSWVVDILRERQDK